MSQANMPYRKQARREAAAARQAARSERTIAEQLAVLADRGHLQCREVGRLVEANALAQVQA